ncbi:MAG TPA: DUF4350 domain-containing protein [Terracidiphilus sp.]|nr:DUF4350 domain-containing protein [Terracidiphilus sp.]
MKLFASLDPKDRRLMLGFLGGALALAVLIGVLMPNGNENDNPVPSTYLNGQHGGRAAYDTLLRSGYQIQRWERPLSELAAKAGPGTVVIVADPHQPDYNEMQAMKKIVMKGARVLATGAMGGYLVPGGNVTRPQAFHFAACELEPNGLDALADTGQVWMVLNSTWQVGNPSVRVQYTCAGEPAVVEYGYGKGRVVWWAGSTPLENASLERGQDLNLLLNSLGPAAGHHFYWDESLHGDVRSNWSYAAGPALTLLRVGLVVVGLLIVFSFSRRSGPVREMAAPSRASPTEFVEALGSLYRNAKAAGTAVGVALERFRRQSLRMCGMRPAAMSADVLAATLRRRFPGLDAKLEEDLRTCEEAAVSEGLEPKQALKLVQALDAHGRALQGATQAGPQAGTQAGTLDGVQQNSETKQLEGVR